MPSSFLGRISDYSALGCSRALQSGCFPVNPNGWCQIGESISIGDALFGLKPPRRQLPGFVLSSTFLSPLYRSFQCFNWRYLSFLHV